MEKNRFEDRVEAGNLTFDEVHAFDLILRNLHKQRGVDFRQYRPRCLRRRIIVGMRDAGVATIEEYVRFLEKNPQAYDKLVDRITINVSEFFRNRETFKAIEKKVVPDLVEHKTKLGSNIIRVWSAGCALGEEPYSLAILFNEYFEKHKARFVLRIIATDIDKDALKKAEEGCYNIKSLRELTAVQIRYNFEKISDEEYTIKPALKNMVNFACHNMISDEPPKHIDLILCRNVIIYFSRELQKHVFENFYKALVPHGFFVAGRTETLMDINNSLYEKVDLAERIIKKIDSKNI